MDVCCSMLYSIFMDTKSPWTTSRLSGYILLRLDVDDLANTGVA